MGEYRPMLAELAPEPFDHQKFIFEPKWDGVRAIAYVENGHARIIGRNGTDLTDRFPEFQGQFRIPWSMVLDGEIFCGEGTTADFPKIQERVHLQDAFRCRLRSQLMPATFAAFDVLEWNGETLVRAPLAKRKMVLDKALPRSARVVHTQFIPEYGIAFFEAMAAAGYEGAMAKHLEGTYVQGKRSPLWQKFKVSRSDVFLAVGYTQGQGAREGTFGALVLASQDEGRLVYRGEVGTGFAEEALREILAMAKDANPHFGIKGVHWIEPIRVRVKYLDTTEDGKLRFPSFKGLEER